MVDFHQRRIAIVAKKLIIHLGLPKTGTTTLQTKFWPMWSGYGGKFFGFHADGSVRMSEFEVIELFTRYWAFCDPKTASDSNWRDGLARWVDQLRFDDSGLLIFSEEALSTWPRDGEPGSWVVQYDHAKSSGTHPISIFLAELRNLLPDEITLCTITFLRNQSDPLGSFAAEARRVRNFNSAGFKRLCRRADPILNFYQLVLDLEKVSGPQNHLTLFFEDGFEKNGADIIGFIEVPNLRSTSVSLRDFPQENRRKFGKNRWVVSNQKQRGGAKSSPFLGILKLSRRCMWCSSFRVLGSALTQFQKSRESKSIVITISTSQRLKVRKSWQESNDLLVAHVNRNLRELGY